MCFYAQPSSWSTRILFMRRVFIRRLSVRQKEGSRVIWTVFLFLVVLWLLGLATGYTLGGFIHILLLLAVASVAVRLISGRRLI
jgi:fatty acid desaturase